MKQFFKFVFATIVGIIITTVLFLIVCVGIIAAVSGDKTVDVSSNSILHIAFKANIPERTPDNPLTGLLGIDEKVIGLDDILANIKKAKTDDHIKGIFLDESYMLSGQATTEEIRNALIDFKKSGKFVVAYAEIYTQSFYYLASVADKVYINPKGIFDLHGFSSQVTFLKGALDKLGIDMQIIKVGTYKSAVEPFFLTKMSPANREQVTSYLGSMYDFFLTNISSSRHINKDTLFNVANNMLVRTPEDALKYKLVDGIKYKDELLDELRGRTGTDKKKNVRSVDIVKYTKADGDNDRDTSGNSRIAIVYASGEISGGEGDDNSIGSDKLSATLRKVRMDDKVKAVVLRVNSPGGSSLASDVIWREVALTKKVKPIIVSMGDVAASGGYYISCAADSIFAEPNTITGSIGIFAVLPNMQKFFNDKLGVTFDGVKTGKYADLGNVSRPLTADEKAILQTQVNRGYDEFTKAVANGRHKTQEYINSIGQGRVWTGQQALKIGLVDRLGSIDDAIACAAKKAKVKNYNVTPYPELNNSLLKSLGRGASSHVRVSMLKSEMGDNYKYYQKIKEASQLSGLQMRMAYEVEVR
jgi:protease IV